jgi:hypothetical protein
MSEFRDQLERTRKSDSSGSRKGMPTRRCARWSTCLSGLLSLLLLASPPSVSAVRAPNLNFIVQVCRLVILSTNSIAYRESSLASISVWIAPLRPWLLGVAVLLLVLSFWQIYRRGKQCGTQRSPVAVPYPNSLTRSQLLRQAEWWCERLGSRLYSRLLLHVAEDLGVTSTGVYCQPVCPARTPAFPVSPLLWLRRRNSGRWISSVLTLPARDRS